MKRGNTVAVCYDGKWGRRVKGEVIATCKGHKILVRFPEWGKEHKIIEHWFKVKRRKIKYGGPRKYFAGWVPVERSLMQILFGVPGDWYAVYKWE
jgi:hypothetical protein